WAARAVRPTILARRAGMGSWTALQLGTGGNRPGSQATALVRGIDRIAGQPTQSDRIPTMEVLSIQHRSRPDGNCPEFVLVIGLVEPPAGIEPATPSLPWNHRKPLVEPPSSPRAPAPWG